MLALHTWTLDTTPLAEVLRVAKRVGWDGIELRRVDFARAAEAGKRAEWMGAEGAERERLLGAFAESCRWAAELGARTVMSPVDKGRLDLRRAATSLRAVGALALKHGVRLALEFNSQAEQLNTLASVREVLALANDPSCGLLLDTYHLGRSGATLAEIEKVPLAEIAYVQFSDVPRSGLEPGKALDRLPPGRGSVPFKEIFALLARKGYRGFMSYEAPNPAAWARPAEDVAREALEATRSVLPR